MGLNYHELAAKVAAEIEDGFVAHEGPKWFIDENDDERPAELTVATPSLAGQVRRELDKESRGTFEHNVSYDESINLRKGAGIVVKNLMSDDGVYSGEALVQVASDDYGI